MSEYVVCIIPTDPTFVPAPAAARAGAELLTQLDADGNEARAVDEGHVVFIDAGENYQSSRCPGCGWEVDVRWWGGRMNDAFATDFTDLRVTMPCCGLATSLNDLDYDFPQGFARWRLEIVDPNLGELNAEQVRRFAETIGQDVRVIYSHY